MTTLVNNFDGGPDGTTITTSNSGQFGNNPFDSVTTTNATAKFNVQFGRPTAEYVLRLATGAVSANPRVIWSTSIGAQSQIWFRVYALYPTLPTWPPQVGSSILMMAFSGATTCTYIGIDDATGCLFLADCNAVTFDIATTPIIAGTWMRIECRLQFGTSTGNGELRYYTEADSDTPADVLIASGWNFGAATANAFHFGYPYPNTNLQDFYISGLELNNIGWPGPAPYKVRGIPAGNLTNSTAIHQV